MTIKVVFDLILWFLSLLKLHAKNPNEHKTRTRVDNRSPNQENLIDTQP